MILELAESHSFWRVYFLGLMILLGSAIILITSAYRQLFQGKYWTAQMAQSSTRAVRIPAPRGNILDRNGIVLVGNRPSYNVALYLYEFGAGRNEKKLLKVVRNSVEILKQRMKMPIGHVNDRVVLNHYNQRGPLPLTVWNDLSPVALATFEERSPWMPGVDLQINPVRVYPFGTLASHILGYVGKPETNVEEDFDSLGRQAFSQPHVVGKTGIEASMDRVLQGTQGLRIIKLNASGLKEAEISNAEPTPGNSVVLSIDQEIQNIVEEAIANYQGEWAHRGACVILDPRNGDVLAMASIPSYDLNLFVPAIKRSDWNSLHDDERNPLTNRAIQGGYSPGSTFKVITALAGLETGKINPSTSVECLGSFFLGNIEMGCWKKGGHGDMDLKNAITESCNVYFYTLGKNLGVSSLWNMASAFGLGKKTGIPLDESAGIWESDARKLQQGKWMTGDAVNMAIGQGILNVTPLQMANIAATLANGGTVYKPRLVLKIETPEGEEVLSFSPEVENHIPASSQNIQTIREGMLQVIESEHGTGRSVKGYMLKDEGDKSLKLDKIRVAGKTGSAQWTERGVKQKPRTWMISFAPYDEPRYAIGILAEGGDSGGGTAGPIVGAIYRKLFQLEQSRKNPKRMVTPGRPSAVAAAPVSEGEITGELMDNQAPAEPITSPEEENVETPPPSSLPAEKVNIQ